VNERLSIRICLVHNEYGKLSGEEVVVAGVRRLLEGNGHQVVHFVRGSADKLDSLRTPGDVYSAGGHLAILWRMGRICGANRRTYRDNVG
jgi:hypothetical protein